MKAYLSLFAMATIVILGGAIAMYTIESPHEDAQIKTWLDAFWWTVATTTTVGYGDVVPVTDLGRTVAIFYMFFGIAVAGVFLSLIGTKYYKKRIEPKEDQEITYSKKIIEKMDQLEKKHNEDLENLRDEIKNLKDKIN